MFLMNQLKPIHQQTIFRDICQLETGTEWAQKNTFPFLCPALQVVISYPTILYTTEFSFQLNSSVF